MQGVNESLEGSAERDALKKETPEQAAARLRAESKDLRQSVRYDACTAKPCPEEICNVSFCSLILQPPHEVKKALHDNWHPQHLR